MVPVAQSRLRGNIKSNGYIGNSEATVQEKRAGFAERDGGASAGAKAEYSENDADRSGLGKMGC
jgi:hypothetical protein